MKFNVDNRNGRWAPVVKASTAQPKFALFQGVLEENFGQKFFSTNHPEQNQTQLDDRRVAYRILGYADTIEEAQEKLDLQFQRRKRKDVEYL